MGKQITILTLTGQEPFTVFLCDGTFNNCIFRAQINNVDIPYSFLVPNPYSQYVGVGVKVIDANGCEIKNTIDL